MLQSYAVACRKEASCSVWLANSVFIQASEPHSSLGLGLGLTYHLFSCLIPNLWLHFVSFWAPYINTQGGQNIIIYNILINLRLWWRFSSLVIFHIIVYGVVFNWIIMIRIFRPFPAKSSSLSEVRCCLYRWPEGGASCSVSSLESCRASLGDSSSCCVSFRLTCKHTIPQTQLAGSNRTAA